MNSDERNVAECDGGGGELLVAVLYGEASAAETAEFERHARGCANCRDEFAAFRSVRESLNAWEQEPVPAIRIEIRPSLGERLRRAFGSMSAGMRAATAAACAMLVLAALNTEVSVGRDGLSVRTSLLPRAAEVAAVAPGGSAGTAAPGVVGQPAFVQASATDEQVNRLVDEALRARLERQREELAVEIAKIERQLAASSSAELKQMAARLAAQRRQIETLQRDVDRQAGYDGGDLFGELTSERGGS